MGIDILFPIVRTPSLSSLPPSLPHPPPPPPAPSPPATLFLSSAGRFTSPLSLASVARTTVPLRRRRRRRRHRRRFFFGWRSAFFSIIILFRIQSIISISIVLRYFHLASHSERDETTRAGGGEAVGWRWLFQRRPRPPPSPPARRSVSVRCPHDAATASAAPLVPRRCVYVYVRAAGITMASPATIR